MSCTFLRHDLYLDDFRTNNSSLLSRSLYDIQWGINNGVAAQFDFAQPFTGMLSLMLSFAMLPRFIIGIRELYDRDCHRQCQGIDTGFGILSRFIAADNVTLSGIVFADEAANGQIGEGQTGDTDMIPLQVVTELSLREDFP